MNIIFSFFLTIIVQFQRDWEKGLQTVDDAIWAMPKVISQHLFKYKLIFKSRMGKSVDSDMTKFQVKSYCMYLWLFDDPFQGLFQGGGG